MYDCPIQHALLAHKFTGKERDAESGLDNFGARYDSSSMGRFMSADPIFIEAHRLGDPQQLNLYSYVRNNPLNLTDSTGMLIDVNCSQVSAAQCSQTVTDLNNRQGAQFQVTRDDKTGQLNVVGNVDVSKLSDSERALYNAVTDTSATGTLNVVAKDPSFDFEKYDKPGQNSLDRSDLNVLGGADKSLPGEVIAHAALESFDSASKDPTYDAAHAFANKYFGQVKIFGPKPLDSLRGGIGGLAYYYEFQRNHINVFVVREFDTPIPFQSLPRGNNARALPGNITKVEKDKNP